MPKITDAEIEHRFGYHRATFPVDYDVSDPTSAPLHELAGAQDDEGKRATAPDHSLIRTAFIQLAQLVRDVTPEGREQSLALTTLQESMMWANASVAMRSPLIRE